MKQFSSSAVAACLVGACTWAAPAASARVFSLQPTPNPQVVDSTDADPTFHGASCPSASDCMAVGQYENSSPSGFNHVALVERGTLIKEA